MSKPGFWEWSVDVYQRPGLEDKLINLQDNFDLEINVLLWCCWAGAAGYGVLPEIAVRNAVDLTDRWSGSVVAGLRRARRALKSPPARANPQDVDRLRTAVKSCELDSEHIMQDMLEALSRDLATPNKSSPKAAARRNLATYAALAGVARRPGFSTSRLHAVLDAIFLGDAS